MLTHKRAKELFDYDPITGILTSRVRRGSKIASGDVIGSPHSQGYLQMTVDGEKYLVHRVIWFLVTGEWPEEVDHKNLVKTENWWDNLREADRFKNNQNTRMKSRNETGIKGVSPKRGKWRARIRVNGKDLSLGSFVSKELAAAAYAQAARQHFGEFARVG